ncbi:hypothetical protein ES703_20634 [subsurface metagenome]
MLPRIWLGAVVASLILLKAIQSLDCWMKFSVVLRPMLNESQFRIAFDCVWVMSTAYLPSWIVCRGAPAPCQSVGSVVLSW